MNSESKKSISIDLAVIITILTGFSYLITYLFYAGEFTYYKLPFFLIDINIINIIYSMLLLSPLAIVITLHSIRTFRRPKTINKEIPPVDVPSRKYKKKRSSKLKYLSLLIFLAITIPTYFLNKNLLISFIFGIILSFLSRLAFLLYKRRYFVYLTILCYIVISVLSFGLGYIITSENKTYIIVQENNKTFVAVTVYNDQFVLSPFNIKTKKFSKEYSLKELKDVKNFRMMRIDIEK